MNPLVGKIRGLLASQAHERQIAAAIVLGEIGARDAAVVDALAAAAAGGVAPVQRHALEALARLAGGKTARRVMPTVIACFASREEPVRRAAIDAAIAFGDDAVGPARQRLAAATDVAERRALEEVLGRVGGKDAFSALLAALDTTDVDAARAAALAVRQRVKEATPREKAGYLAQVTKLLRAKGRATRKKGANPALVAGGLKIVGYLEDPAALPTLLAFARDKRQPTPVREEAIVALRFTARGKAGARVATVLAELAERAPAELARPALYSMASLELPPALVPRLKKLALGAEAERALLAIERLAQIATPAGADALAGVLTATQDRMRAEAAANAVVARPEGPQALARALLAVRDGERAVLLARLLRPRVRALADGGPAGKKLAKALVANALSRIGDGQPADALLPLAREIDRDAAGAGLRALAGRLQKRKQGDAALAVLRLVGHAADATPDDGYALAAAELRAGRRDEALAIVQQLVERGFDVAGALRRDRQVSPEQRYQVGFVLVERRQPAGEEILADLAGAGRNKIAKMAKAKLKSAGYA
ncbi:MAG TPA: hypothetical protein VKQ32_24450 [Polyangia bacterium]|nr:hypothetical protein [Polyangia bacterium]